MVAIIVEERTQGFGAARIINSRETDVAQAVAGEHEAMITQTFAAEDARAAFDLIETHPEQTIKVQLAFDA